MAPRQYEILFRDRTRGHHSKQSLACPECGRTNSQVKDNSAAEFDGIVGYGRRRVCGCGHQFRTVEYTAEQLEKLINLHIGASRKAITKLQNIKEILED